MRPLAFHHAETGCSLVIDDDGRVAWAYLRSPDDEIVADVWLYNRAPCEAPPDWTDASQAPFLNPPQLARPFEGRLPVASELEVRWALDGPLLLADVLVRGALLARLSPGAAPGWNVLALIPGPCAVPFPKAT
ncbi:MAG: hypothetical protein JNJ54_16890 [Myxococcaceae bacterium]|nr:hypothetical protein [Myxococcaceae bacterium]